MDIADLEKLDIIRKLTQGDEGTLSAAGQETVCKYCINTIARIWETYGPLVLGRYLEETTKESNDKNASASHWLSVVSCMFYCWYPEKYLTSMSEAVIDECLDRLEKEDRTWEDEIHCMEKCMAVSYGATSYKDFHLPTERIERRQRLMQLQEYWDSPFSSSFEDRMFGICCRSYKKMNGSQKDRFMTLLMKPHFYIRFFCGAEYNLNCAVDCLKKTELCFEAASLLVYRMLRSDRREWSDALPEFDPVYRKQIGGLLGKILGENLLRERIGSDRIDSLRDILICFSEQAGIYFRDRNMRESAAYGDVFRALFQSLMEDDEVEERLCHDLPASLCWMIQKGRRPLSVCALGVLGDLVNESAFRERSTKKDKQEAFNGLILFLKRFLAKEDLLSFCSWDIFLSDHWAEVLQCDAGNEEKLEDVWNRLISEENNAFPEEERWSRTFQHRELAAICLVLKQVICRGDTKKEKKWTGEFFDQPRKLKLFEGETIKDMGFQAVLRYCLAGVSSFSSEGTRRFRDMLSAPDAVDCIFWYPCMNDDQLKKRCHELISGIRFEDLREELLFLPTYVHAGDQLVEILYILKDEVSKRKAEEEDYERIKETLERLLDFLKEIIQKNVNRKKEFGEWLKHAEERLLLLEGKLDSLLKNTDTTPFYRGLALFESGDIDGLEEAVKIFREHHTQGNISGTINLMLCLCEIIEIRIKRKENWDRELEEVEILASRIRNDELLDTKYKIEAFYYPLRMFYSSGMKDRFLKLYYDMPEEYRGDKTCGTLILKAAEQYVDRGLFEKEKNLLETKYGKSFVEGMDLIIPEPSFVPLNDVSLKTIRNAIDRIPNLSLYQSAEVLYQGGRGDQCNGLYKDLCSGLSGSQQLSDQEAALILKMIFRTAVSLREMSRSLLHDRRAAAEDTYNENFSRLFNLSYSEWAGFSIKDQSQGGITASCTKRGESGTGRRDMILMHRNCPIMLLEGIRMESMDTSAVKEHINRLPQYDDSNMPLTAVIVYMSVKNTGLFHDRYFEFLKELSRQENYNDTNCIEARDMYQEMNWSAIGIESRPDAVFRTVHSFPGESREKAVFHILIDVNRLGTVKGCWGK